MMVNLDSYAMPGGMPVGEAARVARLLSLGGADADEVGLARRVGEGLPTRAVTVLVEIFGRARIVGPVVPEATLRRLVKSGKPLPREHSERLYELGRVIDAASAAFHGDLARIEAFLDRPHPLLDGATPFDMARSSSAGADAVLGLIRRAEAGIAL